jgi:polygalacturonase
MPIYDVTAFGARADGQALDTAAIQGAVDACAAAGGGRVLCPPGTYRVGSLELKDHVEIHLEAGATLLASDDPRDYRKRLAGEHWVAEEKLNCDQHLIYADSRHNVALTGRGLIDGRCAAFMVPHPTKPAKGLIAGDWRPGQLIHFNDCQDVSIRDVRIRNSPSSVMIMVAS